MDWNPKERVTVVTGHFGSGKTEFSTNYSVHLAKTLQMPVTLVDLDIVNTYFRVRELGKVLSEKGVQVLSTTFEVTTLDIPALDPAIEGAIVDSKKRVIIDVGGNPSGARALGRYKPVLEMVGYDQVFVVNANRKETQTPEQVIDFITMTQAQSQTRINGLINTTHLLKETSLEDILRGQELVKKVSAKTGIPVVLTVALERLVDEGQKADPSIPVFPIELFFRTEWMM